VIKKVTSSAFHTILAKYIAIWLPIAPTNEMMRVSGFSADKTVGLVQH
jgi:hypothetical protein